MSQAPLVSVVVPISNADAHPRAVVEGLAHVLRSGGYPVEFVLVLDGPVGPAEREAESIDCGAPVKLVRLQGGGLGESIALSAGVARAAGKYIVNVPPYVQTEPEDVLKVVAALDAGADCVATWRTPRVDPWLNQLQSRLFNFMLRMIMGMPYHDLNSGTRGFKKQVLEEVSVYGELYRFLPVLALRQGFRVVEVKVRHLEEKGRSGFYGVGVYLRRLLDILTISFLTRFTQQPLRFFGYVGFLAMIAGVALAALPLWEKLAAQKSLSDRPLFVLGAILAAFGVQLIGFGLIGEIIIFTQAPNLRDYKVEEIIEGGAETAPGHAESVRAERAEGAAPAATASAADALTAAPTAAPGASPTTAGEVEPLSLQSAQSQAVMVAATPAIVRVAATVAQRHDNGIAAVRAHDGATDELPLRVRELLPGEDSRWDAYVTRHPQGSFFHLSGWRRCVSEMFRHKSHALVVEQGRRWLGVLPLHLVRSLFLGRHLISLPYGVYGGVLADNAVAQQALLDRATLLGRELRAGYVELRHLDARPGVRTGSHLYVTFRCALPEDPAQVMPAIPKRARAEVRRARRAPGGADKGYGLQVLPDCDLDTFFALFAENKRRLGSPALPRAWFAALVEEFGSKVVFHRVVDAHGDTLAAVMSFLFKDTINAYYSGSRTGINDTGANNLIYCGIMEWAVQEGFTRFDFGRSRVESGPAHFKQNMGFVAEPLHYEYILVGDDARPPQFHPGNPKLDLPRRLWSRLPMWIANRLGTRLSRHLP